MIIFLRKIEFPFPISNMDNLDVAYTIAERAIHQVFAWHAEILLLRGVTGLGDAMSPRCHCQDKKIYDSRRWHKELSDFHIVTFNDVVISPETATLELFRKFDIIAIRDILTMFRIHTPTQWQFVMLGCKSQYSGYAHTVQYGNTVTFKHMHSLTTAIEYINSRIMGLGMSDDLQNHVDLIQKNNELSAELTAVKKQLVAIRGALGTER